MHIIIIPTILAIPILVAIAGTLIYMPFYRKKINTRLSEFKESNTSDNKPVMTPIKIFVIYLISCVITIALIIIISVNIANSVPKNEPYFRMKAQDGPSLLDRYEPGETIPGYTLKSTIKETNVEIYFYVNQSIESYDFFPNGIIAVKYTGSDEQYAGIKVLLNNFKDMNCSGSYSYGGTVSDNSKKNKWLTFDTDNFYGDLSLTACIMKKSASTGKTKDVNTIDQKVDITFNLSKELSKTK